MSLKVVGFVFEMREFPIAHLRRRTRKSREPPTLWMSAEGQRQQCYSHSFLASSSFQRLPDGRLVTPCFERKFRPIRKSLPLAQCFEAVVWEQPSVACWSRRRRRTERQALPDTKGLFLTSFECTPQRLADFRCGSSVVLVVEKQ